MGGWQIKGRLVGVKEKEAGKAEDMEYPREEKEETV